MKDEGGKKTPKKWLTGILKNGEERTGLRPLSCDAWSLALPGRPGLQPEVSSVAGPCIREQRWGSQATCAPSWPLGLLPLWGY